MKKWTNEQYQFLLDHLNGTPVRDLAAMLTERFGQEFSYGRVKSYLADHKLKTGAPRGCNSCGKQFVTVETIKSGKRTFIGGRNGSRT